MIGPIQIILGIFSPANNSRKTPTVSEIGPESQPKRAAPSSRLDAEIGRLRRSYASRPRVPPPRVFFGALGVAYVALVVLGAVDLSPLFDVVRLGASFPSFDIVGAGQRLPVLASALAGNGPGVAGFTATVWCHALLLDLCLARQLWQDAVARSMG